MSVKFSDNLSFYTLTTGVVITPDASGDATLPAGTYFVDIGDAEYHKHSVQWEHDAALIASITYERTLQRDASLFAAASTQWKDSGVAALVINAAAGTTIADFADQLAGRMRAVVVVTTQGKLRGNAVFKAG